MSIQIVVPFEHEEIVRRCQKCFLVNCDRDYVVYCYEQDLKAVVSAFICAFMSFLMGF